MDKKIKALLLVLLAVLLVGGGILIGIRIGGADGGSADKMVESEQASTGTDTATDLDENAVAWTGEQEVSVEKNEDTIDIPGYGSITLKAGETEQSVNFYNPEQNTCYFRMTLLLSNGTQLWQSGLIEPGQGLYEITLEQTLEAGEYEEAVLKYECFAMDDDRTPLNGSEIKLTLNVME
ncbi:MAG: tRNA (uracil-5-)-methyltransferase [Lachnospiraceae bacterium]|nr:tRNA (uracil-5-)-methyltransferase [Lachnospiraceae bacterium]